MCLTSAFAVPVEVVERSSNALEVRQGGRCNGNDEATVSTPAACLIYHCHHFKDLIDTFFFS